MGEKKRKKEGRKSEGKKGGGKEREMAFTDGEGVIYGAEVNGDDGKWLQDQSLALTPSHPPSIAVAFTFLKVHF